MIYTWLVGKIGLLGARILVLVTLIAIVAGSFWYLRSLTDEIATLTADNKTLKTEVDTKTKQLAAYAEAVKQITKNQAELQQGLSTAQRKNHDTIKTLSKHDFSKLLQQKPGLVGSRIQHGSDRLWDDFESATQ